MTGYKETHIQKVYGMERLIVTRVRNIYLMERTVECLPPTEEMQIVKNSTNGNSDWLKFSSEIAWLV